MEATFPPRSPRCPAPRGSLGATIDTLLSPAVLIPLMFDLLSDFRRRAADALRQALGTDAPADAIPGELPVVVAGRPEFGDYQISACLQLGKSLKRQPRQLAETVAAA